MVYQLFLRAEEKRRKKKMKWLDERDETSQKGKESNFRDVWSDNTPPGLNGCSFNSPTGPDSINRLAVPSGCS